MGYTFYKDRAGFSEGRAGADGSAEYTRGHFVAFDEFVGNVLLVGTIPEIFEDGITYPLDPLAYLTQVAPRQTDDPSQWEIIVTYARPKLSEQRPPGSSPLDVPPRTQWGSTREDRPFIYQENGYLFTNSAVDPFVPPPTYEALGDLVTVTYNLGSVPAWVRSLKGRTNSGAFTLEGQFVDVECARILDVQIAEPEYENQVRFRRVIVPIELRDAVTVRNASYTGDGGGNTTATNLVVPGHWLIWQDSGRRHLVDGDLVKILGTDGTELAADALLDGTGAALTVPVAHGEEFYRVARKYPTVDFSVLNLPAVDG